MEERKVNGVFYDLEVSRDIVEGYGNKWEFKVVKFIRHQELMCYSYKRFDDKKVTFISRYDFKTMKEFVSSLRDVLHDADIAIAHNGKKFDNKMANRFFIKHGVEPPAPYFTVDTLQVARQKFKFQGNSLNDLCEYLELGAKEKITYADLEDDFMSGSPSKKTMRALKKYNNMDVELLEKLYYKLRPYISNHPNMARLMNRCDVCPMCGAPDDRLERRGYQPTKMGLYRRYKCKDCLKWSQSARPIDRIDDVQPTVRNIAGN